MKNFRKNILLVMLVGTTYTAQAQKGEMVSYKITHDDPYDFKNLFIHLYPAYFELASPFNVGLGVGADYKMNKLLAFNATALKSYFSMAEKSQQSKSFQFIEAGATFSFIDKEKTGKTSVILSSGGGSTYSIKAKGIRVRKELGIRGGAFYYGHPVFYKDLTSVPGITEASIYSNTSGIYAGIGTAKTRNIMVEAEGYGSKMSKGKTFLYFDLMFAPVVSNSHNMDYPISPEPEMDKFVVSKSTGWRTGIMFIISYPKYTMTGGMELGSRPGVSGGYFQMKVGFPLSFNVMNFSKSKEEKVETK
jgi:hypothetical protein